MRNLIRVTTVLYTTVHVQLYSCRVMCVREARELRMQGWYDMV